MKKTIQKQLNNSNIIFLGVMLFALTFIFLPVKTNATNVNEIKLIQLVNQERKTAGLNELKQDPLLYLAAQSKAKDMMNKNYFEHYSPNGKAPWDFIHENGYDYKRAGENLAMDFITSEGIHNAWMKSPTHKDNILKPDYEHIAIAAINGDFSGKNTTLVVQMFASPMPENSYSPQSIIIKIRNLILGL